MLGKSGKSVYLINTNIEDEKEFVELYNKWKSATVILSNNVCSGPEWKSLKEWCINNKLKFLKNCIKLNEIDEFYHFMQMVIEVYPEDYIISQGDKEEQIYLLNNQYIWKNVRNKIINFVNYKIEKIIQEQIEELNKKDELITVGDLIDYLKTLDDNKPINGEYIHVVGSHYTGIQTKPLLKTLFDIDKDGNYILKAMFY